MAGTVDCRFIGRPQWEHGLDMGATSTVPAISIWYGITANLLTHYDACFALLSPQEQTTALRYYQLTHQQRYVLQHGLLKAMLGKYLNVPAQGISFSYNPNKKPYLNHAGAPCFFNLSHSKGSFLIAIGNVEMGVDIERINKSFAYADIASHYFSTAEEQFISASTNPTESFFLLWTRKEALLKACGTGIDDNLPAMPALDGRRDLPHDYANINWLTESFYTGNDMMGSVTYPHQPTNIKFANLAAADIETLF